MKRGVAPSYSTLRLRLAIARCTLMPLLHITPAAMALTDVLCHYPLPAYALPCAAYLHGSVHISVCLK